jgi:thiamine kinase-like enzyme
MREHWVADCPPQAGQGARRAVRAWGDLQGEQIEPTRVDIIKEVAKGAVYRLEGVGPEGSAVIAKRCRAASLVTERAVYEQVLPQLQLAQLQYYGSVEENGGEAGWLFLEDMGGEPYSRDAVTHRTLAAQWLGTIHSAASRDGVRHLLPDRGPAHYLEHLRTGRGLILRYLGNPALTAEGLADLRRIISQFDVVESRWAELTAICAEMPRTLVHGDFNGKNARVRADHAGLRFLMVDWEMAGWGVPAPDLAGWGVPATLTGPGGARAPGLDVYRSVVRQTWPNLAAADVIRMAEVGAVFRVLAAIDWESLNLAHDWAWGSIRNMRVYQLLLSSLIRTFGWEH